MLAGQSEAGEIALLIANPTQSPVQYEVKGVEGHSIQLLQVNDESDRAQTLQVQGNRLEIGKESVQLIVAAKE